MSARNPVVVPSVSKRRSLSLTRGCCCGQLCKPNGKDKHPRSFRLNCDECTLEWAEVWVGSGASAVKKAGKGPFLLTAVREIQPAVKGGAFNPLADSSPTEVKCLEIEVMGASSVVIRPEAGGEYEEWLACLRSVAMKGASLEKMRIT